LWTTTPTPGLSINHEDKFIAEPLDFSAQTAHLLGPENQTIGRKMRMFVKFIQLFASGYFVLSLSERELLLAANALSRNTQNAEANALRWKLLAMIDASESD
jgi:hypothetical protein